MAGLGCWLAQEQFEELFFDGGLEAADEGGGVGAQGAGEVVAFEDEVAGAVDGAEEGDGFAVEEGGVADEGDGRVGGGVGATAQGWGDAGRAGLIACDLQGSWRLGGYAVTESRGDGLILLERFEDDAPGRLLRIRMADRLQVQGVGIRCRRVVSWSSCAS